LHTDHADLADLADQFLGAISGAPDLGGPQQALIADYADA
jgi:hypothetical protein